jgi:glycosyltransferase involved in cell wall biosynthesis
MAAENNMKHILHIITGLQRGGAETVLVTLATELKQPNYNYQQSVIYFKDGILREQLEILGIRCYKASYISVFWLIKKLKPDVIHSSLWSANIVARLYAKLFSIPVYCALHTVAEHSGNIRNYIDKLFPFKPKNYIAVSQKVKKSYAKFLPPQKITIIQNGIPPCAHRAPEGRPPPHPKKQYNIGAIGRFVPVKNYHILLDAFALLHKEFTHTRLILVGHGPLEKNLREQADKLNISDSVTFIINKPAQEFYHQFDCFVQPSQFEGFSLTAAEALQANVPVIVTGPNKQHIFIEHEKHGLVIEPNSVEALRNALKFYILNPGIALHYAQVGKEYVQQHFSAQAMAKKYNTLFYTHESNP